MVPNITVTRHGLLVCGPADGVRVQLACGQTDYRLLLNQPSQGQIIYTARDILNTPGAPILMVPRGIPTEDAILKLMTRYSPI